MAAVTAGRSSPAAAGEQDSRRLPGKSLFQTQLFSTSAAGGRGSETRSSLSPPFPASTTRPAAAPRPGPRPSPRAPWAPERSSRARSRVRWFRQHPRGVPRQPHRALAAASPARSAHRGQRLPLTRPGSASPSPQPPQPGLSVTPPRSHLSGPAGRSGKAEGGERGGGDERRG